MKKCSLPENFWNGFDFGNGKVKYHETYLCEDMLQVEFPDNILLDVGYYSGIFRIYVIKNYSWENPIMQYTYKHAEKSELYINDALKFIKSDIKDD